MKTINDYAELVKEKHALNETIAPVEADETDASKAYAVGEQLILSGILYDVIAPISVHDVITTTGSGANIAPAGPISAKIQTLTNNLSDEVEARATLGAHQLLDVNDNSNPINVAIANNGIISTNTDTRAANIWVKCYKGNTAVGDILISEDLTVGKFKQTFTIPSNYDFDTLWIGHNGATNDLKAKIAFNKTGSFKFICNVTGADTSVSGGYALENILICLATDNDETWQPYAMTNRELTENANIFDYSNVKGVEFQTVNNRMLIALYTDDAKRNGLRIDFNGNDNVIQLNTIVDGTMSGHNRVSFPVIT